MEIARELCTFQRAPVRDFRTQFRNSRPWARVPAPGCAAIGRQLRW